AGGLIGRKAGAGFYAYPDGQKQAPAEPAVPAAQPGLRVWISPAHEEGHARAQALLESLDSSIDDTAEPPEQALIVVTPYGEDVSTCAYQQGLDAARTVGLDTLHGLAAGKRRTLMLSPATQAAWRDAAHALLAADGAPVSVIQDSPGFVAQRI